MTEEHEACLRGSCCFNETLWPKASWKIVCFAYTSTSLFSPEGSQRSNSSRAGTWHQGLMQKPWKNVVYLLAPHGLIILLYYKTQDHQPRVLYRFAYNLILKRHFLKLRIPPLIWLYLVSNWCKTSQHKCPLSTQPLDLTYELYEFIGELTHWWDSCHHYPITCNSSTTIWGINLQHMSLCWKMLHPNHSTLPLTSQRWWPPLCI